MKYNKEWQAILPIYYNLTSNFNYTFFYKFVLCIWNKVEYKKYEIHVT